MLEAQLWRPDWCHVAGTSGQSSAAVAHVCSWHEGLWCHHLKQLSQASITTSIGSFIVPNQGGFCVARSGPANVQYMLFGDLFGPLVFARA
jgi:hypothetical protein